MTPRTRACVVVETHFVGDYSDAPARPPAIGVEEFERLLDKLLAEREPITAVQLRDWFDGTGDLPEKSLYLTFDDGIRDHATNVVPLLLKRGLEGAFFVPGSIFDPNGRLPALERQRYLQYGFGDYRAFLDALIAEVPRRCPGVREADVAVSARTLAAMGDHLANYPFYSPEERYYRWLRDKVLSPEDLLRATDSLFAARFPDERALMERYYLSPADLKDIAAAGMAIGCHGHVHEHLPRLRDQAADLVMGLDALESITGRRPWIASYPFGSYDDRTLGLMDSLGMGFAFTTGNRVADLNRQDRHTIPRLDIAEVKSW
ncbi:MAG: polysaccharide deacetylase family protein [Alphaproteobacteria bacterium]|nr:polysaccharide deacetylase family protein [Alphaproteobacteria bacterium]MBF0332472.1 polysaccharide deacetylase family protein [Alphaproteobacteria bacterium]